MNNELKIFAEFIEENGVQYRTRTILKFGDSWNLIGTIVMKNPGSAYPINKINLQDFNCIEKYYYPEIGIENWYEFKKDSTINKISNIFDGTYSKQKTELNGVILIYNLFNLREKDIVEAVKKANISNSKHLLPNLDELITLSQNKPIYLGFNWEYTNKTNKHQQKIEKFANDLFDYVKGSDNMYLEDEIFKNYFYHPLSSKISNQKYRHILDEFYKKLTR